MEKTQSQHREQSFKLNELRFVEESTVSRSFFSFPLKAAQASLSWPAWGAATERRLSPHCRSHLYVPEAGDSCDSSHLALSCNSKPPPPRVPPRFKGDPGPVSLGFTAVSARPNPFAGPYITDQESPESLVTLLLPSPRVSQTEESPRQR